MKNLPHIKKRTNQPKLWKNREKIPQIRLTGTAIFFVDYCGCFLLAV
jgi:hypothetical protein